MSAVVDLGTVIADTANIAVSGAVSGAVDRKDLIARLTSGCVSSQGSHVQQETNLPGEKSGAP
jgi:hypothetical protein